MLIGSDVLVCFGFFPGPCEAPKKITHFTLNKNAKVFCTFLLKLESIAWAVDDGVSGLHCVWQVLVVFHISVTLLVETCSN